MKEVLYFTVVIIAAIIGGLFGGMGWAIAAGLLAAIVFSFLV